jgi:hypothetical protein
MYSAFEAGTSTRLTQSTGEKDVFSAAVFYFDTQAHVFGSLDPLPTANNIPMTAIKDDVVFILGGETAPLFGSLNTHVNMILAMLLTEPATKAAVDTDEFYRTSTLPLNASENRATVLTDVVNPYTGTIGAGLLERYHLDGNAYHACTKASVDANIAACLGPLIPLHQQRGFTRHKRLTSFRQIVTHG